MKILKQFLKNSLLMILGILVVIVTVLGVIKIKASSGIAVLGYHGVVSDQAKKAKYEFDQYTFSASEFEEQLKYLKANDYKTLTLEQLYAYYKGDFKLKKNCKYVALTFDDGLKNYKTIVEPLLKKYDMKASCFVITSKLNKNNNKYLSYKDIKNNKYSKYYSHTDNLHHFCGQDKKIQCSSYDDLKNDFKRNKLKVDCEFIAYPYGVGNKRYTKILKSNHVKLAFSYNQFRNFTRNDNQYYVPRYLMFSKMGMNYFKFIVN